MKRTFTYAFLLLSAGWASAYETVSSYQLEEWLLDPDPPVIIDIRSQAAYAESHLPGAINIPWTAIASRRLPPLGAVVVYDSGLGHEKADEALAALSAKSGIEPYYLDGGLAAWNSRSRSVAKTKGVEREDLPFITYRQAMEMLPGDTVLIDMRPAAPAGEERALPAGGDPVENWARSLGKPIRKGLPEQANGEVASPAGAESSPEPLLVLIDDDPARAIETARRMKDRGHTRFVILAGGVEAIQFKGQPGVERIATGLTLEDLPNE